jgi:hypothetical protein
MLSVMAARRMLLTHRVPVGLLLLQDAHCFHCHLEEGGVTNTTFENSREQVCAHITVQDRSTRQLNQSAL